MRHVRMVVRCVGLIVLFLASVPASAAAASPARLGQEPATKTAPVPARTGMAPADQRHYEHLVRSHGAAAVVRLRILGLPAEAARSLDLQKAVRQDLAKATGKTTGVFIFSDWLAEDKVLVMTAAPVADLDGLTRAITFGTVESASKADRTVVVRANADIATRSADTPAGRAGNAPRHAARGVVSGAELQQAIADLKGGDSIRRSLAVQRLARIAPAKDRLAEVNGLLREAYRETGGGYKGNVLRALGVWYTDDALPLFLAALDDANGDTRNGAFEAIGLSATRDPKAIDALLTHLDSASNWGSAKDALLALAEAGVPVSKPLLERLQSGTSGDFMRAQLCACLPHVATREDIPAIEKLAQVPDQKIATAAKHTLDHMLGRGTVARTGKTDERPAMSEEEGMRCLALMKSDKLADRLRGARQFSLYRPGGDRPPRKEVADNLAALLAVESPEADGSRGSILHALGEWALPEHVGAMAALTRHKDFQVRNSAINSLALTGYPEAARTLVSLIGANIGRPPPVQEIQRIGAVAEPFLIERLDDPAVFTMMAQLLGEVGSEASLAALKKYEGRPDFHTRSAAEQAAKRIRARLVNMPQ